MGVFRIIFRTAANYLADSDFVALKQAASSASLTRTVYWLSIFIAGAFLTGLSINELLKDINRYPVVTSTDLRHQTSVPFPAITICNLNRINCRNLLSVLGDLTSELSEGNLTSSEIEVANSTLKMLDLMFGESGCREQMCSVLDDFLPNVRDDADMDPAVFEAIALGCGDNGVFGPGEEAKICYYLNQIVNYSPESSEVKRRRASRKFENLGCDMDDVCEHYLREISKDQNMDDKMDKGYEVADSCKPSLIQPNVPGQPGGGVQFPALPAPDATTQVNTDGTTLTEPDTSSTTTTLSNVSTTSASRPVIPNTSEAATNNSGPSIDPNPSPISRGRRSVRQKKGHNDRRRIAEVTVSFEMENRFLMKYLNIPLEIRERIGHRFGALNTSTGASKGFFKACIYRGMDCTHADFWHGSSTPKFGNCFTFNSASNSLDEEAPRNATLTGVANGLSVEVFLDQDNYMLRGLSPRAGARLIIHDPNTNPLADEYGIDLHPNTASSVAMQMTNVERLPPPYESMCIRDWIETGLNMSLMQVDKPKYSLSTCNRHCIQLDVIESCGCFHTSLDLDLIDMDIVDFGHLGPKGPCSLVPHADDYTCVKTVLDSYDAQTKNCSACSVACHETEYTTAVTSSVWPSDQYWRLMAIDLEHDIDDFNEGEMNELKTRIQSNYLRADIYYQTLNVRSVTQTAKYTNDTRLSALGGALSVYMGVAIVLIFELIECAVLCFLAVWNHMNKPITKLQTIKK